MNVRQLLKCGDSVTTLSLPATTDVVYAANPTPITAQSSVDSNDTDIIDEGQNELDDDDVSYILERLEFFRDRFFSDIPMGDNFNGDMTYNLPKGIVEASRKVQEKNLPEFMDPIILLYPLFAADEILDVYPKYLEKFRTILDNDRAFLDFFRDMPFAPVDPTVNDGTDYEPDGEPDDDDTVNDEDDTEQ